MTLDRAPAHLADMMGIVRELRAIVSSRTQQAFVADRILNLVTEKLFIHLGEASQRLSDGKRAAIAGVPWRQIVGLRNILSHGCEGIDQQTLYCTAAREQP